MNWHNQPEPPVYAAGEREREVYRSPVGPIHSCGLRSGPCDACGFAPPREGKRIAELERELRLTHEQLRASLDREQQLLRERLKLEHQLAVIRCVVCPEGKR